MTRLAQLRRDIGRQIRQSQLVVGEELQQTWQDNFLGARLRLTAMEADERHAASIQTFRQEMTEWKTIPRRWKYTYGSDATKDGELVEGTFDVVDVADGRATLEKPQYGSYHQFRAPLDQIVIIDTEPAELPPVDGAD